jgi:hypothetical protein
VVDAGNLTYPPGALPARHREALDLKARFLGEELRRLPFAGSALGEADLAAGVEKVTPPRLVANLASAAGGAPSDGPTRAVAIEGPGVVREAGGIRFGIFGLSDPEVLRRFGLRAEDPSEAARREGARLRALGAEVVIALVALDRSHARIVARTGAADFVIVGTNPGKGLGRADQVERAFVLAPAEELEHVGRLEVVVRAGPNRASLVDAGGPAAQQAERDEGTRALADLDRDLARWRADTTADRGFVARKVAERERLAQRVAGLGQGQWSPPSAGSYFVNRLVPLSRALPRDPTLASAMKRLDRAMGQASLRTATPPPAAEPGRAAFVGDRSCAKCHQKAAAFWRTTVHARAWKTLVDGGKTLQEDCVSCHVTGFGEVGGSSLGHVERLTAIQCETCHGPGSLHVAAEGLEEPSAVRLETPKSTCERCHNEKHSDTFEYGAYLRDVLGKGHGEQARAKLGKGPTGGELRRAAKAKAKAKGAALAAGM